MSQKDWEKFIKRTKWIGIVSRVLITGGIALMIFSIISVVLKEIPK